jgi:hypothetical protein
MFFKLTSRNSYRDLVRNARRISIADMSDSEKSVAFQELYTLLEQWELVSPRREGDFAGSRVIGSANLVTALNLIHQKILIYRSESDTTSSSDTSMSIFNVAMQQLQEQRLVRKKPNKVRETFQIITANTNVS